MTKRERIEELEKQVAELQKRLNETLLRLVIAESMQRRIETPYNSWPWHLPAIITYDGIRETGDTAQL